MGDPKKPKKSYTTPRNPWDKVRLDSELQLIGTYGLKNKRELWKASTIISNIRRQARMLLGATAEAREQQEKNLINSLHKLGLLKEEQLNLDYILNLTVEDLLERRLQTMLWRKGLAKTVYEARQIVSHKKVLIGNSIVNRPGYLVPVKEEGLIKVNEH
ncbi:MAG: 30S ribosomal protein S4 [Nitrososphaerota archaeon]|jgi:small subunit ribosomal protein S4|nr:30S ribosomal protein S4 [Nitrososphaerota archaeon]MDG6927599.1 30S ribosomal protein S4 [Nitrososphaerota archaeon]MDG6929922.1 30S ribosomal protein S4 [Nitrososphaerota archaeon]MDG6931628.1 30S ribosomal protein S4 [Nitrososphaerota archaeon]MDG6935955.1 30S ribosomal protein S4 [Nitrososphaerota archaeon]